MAKSMCGKALLLGSMAGMLLQMTPLWAAQPASTALPTGGVVTAGQASIAQAGAQMTINQTSQKAILDWQSFNIGAQAGVTFQQPGSSAIALNRVLSSDASVILGKLTANGQVILVNPNGVVFGDGAKVDVGGLVASVLDIKDSDFLAGTLTFQRGTATGSITNKGKLTAADGGYIALLAPEVRNDGVITAKFGTVALAAGDAVTLDLAGNGLVTLQVDPATVKALINNRGMIVATDGQALLSSQAVNALLGGTINNGGAIEADSLTAKGGEISLDASGPITLAGATLDASGATGGGTISVGGWQTSSVAVDGASTLNASATASGNGGSIAVIGGQAQVAGTLLAKGGAAGGNGGQVETSGTTLSVNGAAVDTSAAHGQTGSWLLDPANFIIAASGGDITGTALANELAKTNVTIQSSQGKESGSGDIEVETGVTWSSANSLTLTAYRNIGVNASITNSGGAAVTLRADNTGINSGTVNFTNGAKVGTSGAVSILYNPTSYTAPTDYSGDVTGGALLTAYMLVNDLAHLQAINTNLAGTYALGKSIDASATAGSNGGAGFVPLGNATTYFSGVFDGQGNTISGLSINRPTQDGVGLFGYSSGTIRNVSLSNPNVVGRNAVGALVGVLTYTGGQVSSVTNATTNGRVTGSNLVGGLIGINVGDPEPPLINLSFLIGTSDATSPGGVVSGDYAGAAVNGGAGSKDLGGLVGFNAGTIVNDHSASSVTAGANAGQLGGLVGFSSQPITTSYATGTVKAGDFSTQLGGLLGHSVSQVLSPSNGAVNNSYATGAVSAGNGASSLGGLIGDSDAGVTQSHASGSVTAGTGSSNLGGLIGYSEAGAMVGSVVSNSYATGAVTGGVNAFNIGGLVGDNGGAISGSYATGKVSGGNGAYNLGGLVGDNYDAASYKAGAITSSYASGAVSGGTNASAIGGLVGNDGRGVPDGGSISNDDATGAVSGGDGAKDLGGLIGNNSETITQSFATGSVSGGNASAFLGGLVGYTISPISNSYATGSVTGGNNANALGGLVGGNLSGPLIGANGAVSYSYATGNVTGGSNASGLGGLVGQNLASIDHSYATGRVSGGNGAQDLGGLVGADGYAPNNPGTGYSAGFVADSYATGAVSGGNGASRLGGLVGFNENSNVTGSTITNSYATGGVSSGTSSFDLGGLVGENDASVTNSYSTGKVAATMCSYNVGGLIGLNSGIVTSSYWNTQTSGQSTSAGGTGLTTKQMQTQARFVGWDFVNIWSLPHGEFPQLKGLAGQ